MKTQLNSKAQISIAFTVLMLISLNACNSGTGGGASVIDPITGQEPTYEQKVMSVEETERADPTRFLHASAKYRENIWGGKFIVYCKIKNNATVASYKDAVVRIKYYSKTNTLLHEEDQTIYEKFGPNSAREFEWRIQKPTMDATQVGVEMVSAVAE